MRERFFQANEQECFCKTTKNNTSHRDMKLATNRYKYARYAMTRNFERIICCRDGKTEIKLKKPVYLELVVLDLSKNLMYKFHYEYMQPKDGSKVESSIMDIDSFTFETVTKIFTKTLKKTYK